MPLAPAVTEPPGGPNEAGTARRTLGHPGRLGVPRRQSTDWLFTRGERARIAGNVAQAEEFFRRSLEVDPDNRRARSQLAAVLRQQRQIAAADEVLREGIRRSPSHLPFLHQIIDQCITQSKFEEAQAWAHRGLSLAASYEDEIGFLNQLVQVEQLEGKVDPAITHLRRLAVRQPHVYQHREQITRLSSPGFRVVSLPRWRDAGDEERRRDERLWSYPPEELVRSEFLEVDLKREYTKVSPGFVEAKGPERAVEVALRLAREAISAPESLRPGEDAENLRTAAKLLMDVRERRPDCDYIHFARRRYGVDARKYVRDDHEQTLRKYLSYFASRRGDFDTLFARVHAARSYYGSAPSLLKEARRR